MLRVLVEPALLIFRVCSAGRVQYSQRNVQVGQEVLRSRSRLPWQDSHRPPSRLKREPSGL